MKVILIKDVPGYGTFGDVINVKDGFANNYLIPRGLALPATEGNIKHVQDILKQKQRKLEREKAKAKEMAEKIDGLVIEIARPVGVTGKLYGAITVSEIAEHIKEKTGVVYFTSEGFTSTTIVAETSGCNLTGMVYLPTFLIGAFSIIFLLSTSTPVFSLICSAISLTVIAP